MVNRNVMENMESEFKEYFGTDHVFFVSSGKAALYLILLALKSIRNRTKVIIPAYTCYSVPSAVLKAGLKIVPCDIRAETLDFDSEALKILLDDDTLCIIPTHLFGIPSDVDNIKNICQGRGIYIIEDAAQAMGVTSGEKKLGTLGDVAFFSLGRGKNITCGSGGIIVTYSEEIADVLRKLYRGVKRVTVREYLADIISVVLMSLFIMPFLYWFPHGLPFLKIGETKFYRDFPVFRLSGFQAGLMRRWREALDAYNRGRA
ncbi:MAG TPA: aminotransferase class V-fold PLP-dependent enzyme, partial [Syntrophales bacterium]|nr:aminotransferase class V-fold PLP-dependent enzyme [Syntrophales bacterium]